jgi:hypothetical protein
MSHFDFEITPNGVRKIHSLNETINEDIIQKKREIFICQRFIPVQNWRTIGLRGLSCEINSTWDIQTGYYDIHGDRMLACGWSRQITDCSAFVKSKIRIIQAVFRRHRIPIHLKNIRKIKMFQDVASYLPVDVIKHITESFVKSLYTSKNVPQCPPMFTIETELFQART